MLTKDKILISIVILCLVVVGGTWVTALEKPDFSITFVDVGQGDGAVIQTPGGRCIVIDAGPARNDDMRDSNMLDYLNQKGVKHIDIAVMSHFHDDHYGGFIGIFDQIPALLILMPKPNSDAERAYEAKITAGLPDTTEVMYMAQGDSISIGDDIRLDALFQWDTFDENEKSLVNMLSYFHTKIMFTGDIGEEAEMKMIRELSLEELRADIIKVAHHGSRFSSTSEFFQAVTPEYAVISVGKNMYGHPTSQAIERISEVAEIFRTDKNGSVRFVIDDSGRIFSKFL